MKLLRRYLLVLVRFPPRVRAGMVLLFDLVLCAFGSLFAYSLRIDEWRIFTTTSLSLIVTCCLLWLAIAPAQGVYRSLLRFSGTHAIKDLAKSCAILMLSLLLLFVVLRFPDKMPRTLAVMVPLVLFMLFASSRLVLSSLLRDALYSRGPKGRRQVLIYGAGVAGRELLLSLKDDPEFQVVAFVDDNPVLRRRRLEGCRIWHSSDLEEALKSSSINEVLLALPTASRSRRRQIVEEIAEIAPGVGVRSLPALSEIASGRVSISDLRVIQIEELLGRDQVEPDPKLMTANIRGQVVMVTGAGGSIGSELCRQILLQSPSRIVLAERSEHALYLIDRELHELRARYRLPTEIESRLVDVADRRDVERVFRDNPLDTVFHAAAYKHVPLVEANPIAGIRNNVLGTYNCCVLSEEHGVRNFTLISTDKAVRPSSVMGASKRVCELVVQARAAEKASTTYSAVRFGNVLGSSGSVVPLFRSQIAAGGPVTITHRDATRYFMTVGEAAQLVVQAGAMARGGEIFLLDMGEPVKIRDLAAMMVKLSGLAVAEQGATAGDIDIVEVGLRPGEKIHEELLIDNLAVPTSHPRIVCASETVIDGSGHQALFETLFQALDELDQQAATSVMDTLIWDTHSGNAEVVTLKERSPRKFRRSPGPKKIQAPAGGTGARR